MLLDPELTKNLPVYRHHLTDVFATVRFWYSVEDICRRTPLGQCHTIIVFLILCVKC